MKVRVKDNGDNFFAFWGGRVRKPGDEIELEEGDPFSDAWMEKVEDDDKPKRGRKSKGEGAE